jgi:formate dehydrogenase maturation protein FdhE
MLKKMCCKITCLFRVHGVMVVEDGIRYLKCPVCGTTHEIT